MSLKTGNSRRVANSRPVCMGAFRLVTTIKPLVNDIIRNPTIINFTGMLSKGLIPRALFLGEMRNISPVSFEL
jgi:hypothetical protein